MNNQCVFHLCMHSYIIYKPANSYLIFFKYEISTIDKSQT